jgi:predicted small lipoprotein YifL
MKKLSSLLLLLALLAIAACASAGPVPSTEAQAKATNDIAEAVFRYQFQHNASSLQERADRYCLSLPGEQSPEAAFLQRFDGNTPAVLGVDECRKKSGKNLLFRLQRLDWRSDDEVWVQGGYWEGNLSSSVESYRVRRKDGKWVVDGARMQAIS